jgi:Predicted nucleotide-binding protein containing TIR-like domain
VLLILEDDEMKEIFIGSSKEALDHARLVATLLADVPEVKPLLWTDAFTLGDITFLRIEDIAKRVAGAVFLASPDDGSVIRDKRVKVPRANVLFEYGYLTALLTRSRVALCRYVGTELPSDFSGLTYVPMGEFNPNGPLDEHAEAKIRSWSSELPAVQTGFSPSVLLHGYSGLWHIQTTFQLWRGLGIKQPDYVIFQGQMILNMQTVGEHGTGCIYGCLQVQISNCYAEFQICDLITDARVLPDGSLKLSSRMQSRQRIILEGEPPQQEGFEPMLRAAREFNSIAQCPSDEPGTLRGEYIAELGGVVYSRGIQRYYR